MYVLSKQFLKFKTALEMASSVPNKLIEIEYELYAISITYSNNQPTSALESFTTAYPASASNVGRTCQNSPRML